MIPDYINKFRERFTHKGKFGELCLNLFFAEDYAVDSVVIGQNEQVVDRFESYLTEVYEKGRKDERESKDPLGICENCDIDNHSDCLGCKCHADY